MGIKPVESTLTFGKPKYVEIFNCRASKFIFFLVQKSLILYRHCYVAQHLKHVKCYKICKYYYYHFSPLACGEGNENIGQQSYEWMITNPIKILSKSLVKEVS